MIPKRAYPYVLFFFQGGYVKHHRASSLTLSIILWTLAAMALPLTLAARQHAATSSEEIVGIVTQISATSMTVQTSRDTRDVLINSATVVRLDGHASSISAIAVGDKVEVHAQRNSDGTSTALVIDAESHPHIGLEGVVKSASATSLTITTANNGDVVVNLTADTHFFVNGQKATAADIHTGDHVEVEAQEQTDKTLNALVVTVEIDNVYLSGVISAASATSITVKTSSGDVVVGLTSSTLIRTDGNVVDASVLVIGSRVEVEAVRKADQTLAAITINVERADALAEIEGTVTAVGSDHLTVHPRSGNDVTIGVTTATIIRKDDQLLGLADVKVGDLVHVDARVNTDETFTALRIEIEGSSGDGNHTMVDLTGTIASVASGSITVTAGSRTVTVNISSATVIRRGSTTSSLSELKAGDHVEVQGLLNADGSVAATLIQVEQVSPPPPPHPEAVVFAGTVTAVSATSLTVKAGATSVIVSLTSTTVVSNGDHTGSISDLKIGQHVEVHANRMTDGTLIATQVRIENDSH
jgi:hypothetical protein